MPTVLARRPSDRGGLAIAGAIGTEAAMPYDLRGLVLPREGQATEEASICTAVKVSGHIVLLAL